MYIAPGKGRQTLGVKILMSTERPYHFDHLLQVLKKSVWSLILYIFLNVFMHLYSPRPGADNLLVIKFWRQQKAQITLTICCKFQNDLFEFWFYTHFLIILYMYLAPGRGQTNPWGQNFDVNRKLLPLQPFIASFKQISLNSDFKNIFNVFPHVYSPGAGANKICGQDSDVNRKALSLCPFVVSFKKISLKSDFIHIFACFYTGRGRQPTGVRNFILT